MDKRLKKPMNKQDKQDLELILYRLQEQDKSVHKLEKHFNSKFNEIHEDISFIKRISLIQTKAYGPKQNSIPNIDKTLPNGEPLSVVVLLHYL